MKNTLGNQQGVSLLVSMVILILVSLIGVTALKNASVEEQMSSNLYQKNLTFQASESAVENTILDNTLVSSALISDSPKVEEVSVNVPNTKAEVQFKSLGFAPTLGDSAGIFSGARIMITSTATSGDTRTRTVHGVVRLVPDLTNQ